MWNVLSRWWCRRMHSKAMWPIHGRYICPDCHREYPVAWEVTPPAVEYRQESQTRTRTEPQPDDWGRKVIGPARMLLQRAASVKRSDTM